MAYLPAVRSVDSWSPGRKLGDVQGDAGSAVVPSAAAVHLAGVRKTFGRVRAVDGIDLQLEQGVITALLGPNGGGKTTAIDMILSLSKPDQGTVIILGMSPAPR